MSKCGSHVVRDKQNFVGLHILLFLGDHFDQALVIDNGSACVWIKSRDIKKLFQY